MNKNAIFVSWVTHPLPTKLMLVLLLFSVTLQAQNNSIKGTVSDNIGTMPGVNVIIKGTNIGTLTDSDGNFQITAKTNDTLMFSYLGYKSQEVPINNRNTINIKLREDTTTLSEVVVNAGYYTVKDKERTGSIAKMTANEIEKQPVTNVLASMQGRLAGVSIIQDGGTPGGGFQIRIRG